MKLSPLKVLLLLFCFCFQGAAGAGAASEWPLRLGMQTYSMRGMTLVEALEETSKLGIDYVQIYPGQQLGEGFGDRKVGHTMSAADRERLLQIAQSKGVRIGSYGVVTGSNAADWEAIFAFAKAMGMESVAVEPKQDAWAEAFATIMPLSQKYGIAFGLHNHITDVPPAQTLAELAKINPHLPLFPDTAHWVRSGYSAVEGLEAAQGRLAGVHMSDVDEQSPRAINTPFGEGIAYISGQLAELRRQKFGGVIFMEFGIGKINPELQKFILEEMSASKGYFDRAATASTAELVQGAVVPPGFVTIDKVTAIEPKSNAGQWPQPSALFDAKLAGAVQSTPGAWKWEKNVLSGKGELLSKDSYLNYTINLDFCAQKDGLGAIILNAPDGDLQKALKIVIRQGDHLDEKQLTGAIADCVPVSRPIQIEAGKWYRLMVIVDRGSVTAILDGETMAEMRIRDWKTVGKNPDGTDNPYPVAIKDLLKRGKVGLQDTNGSLLFRDVTVESL